MARIGRTAALVCTLLVIGAFRGRTVLYCEARAGNEEKEVIDFVTAYYEARTPEGIETLADYVAEPESTEFQLELVELQTTFAHGMTGWENIDVAVCPLSGGAYWFVSTSAEMVVENLDVTIPGLSVILVSRNADGKLEIADTGSDEIATDALLKEIREVNLSDEMVERNNKVAMEYNEMIADNQDVIEWLLDTSADIDRAKADALGGIGEDAYGGKDDRYVVKKGDCLWSIAEEQLGDGMLWSGLYETNKDVIGENPDLLYVGIELQIK